MAAVSGNATDPEVLIQAHIAKAGMLVIAIPDTPVAARQMIATARTLNPDIEVVVRARTAEEAEWLVQETAVQVFLAEQELARSMSVHVLNRFGRASDDAARA